MDQATLKPNGKGTLTDLTLNGDVSLTGPTGLDTEGIAERDDVVMGAWDREFVGTFEGDAPSTSTLEATLMGDLSLERQFANQEEGEATITLPNSTLETPSGHQKFPDFESVISNPDGETTILQMPATAYQTKSAVQNGRIAGNLRRKKPIDTIVHGFLNLLSGTVDAMQEMYQQVWRMNSDGGAERIDLYQTGYWQERVLDQEHLTANRQTWFRARDKNLFVDNRDAITVDLWISNGHMTEVNIMLDMIVEYDIGFK
jgi:hypothetical protein